MKELLQTFLELVKIDSPTGQEDTIIAHLLAIAKKYHQWGYVDAYGNLIVKTKGEGVPLFLSAHVDTVEPGKGIKPIITKKIIKTDGTTILGGDNKIGVAVLVELIKAIGEKKIQTRPLEIAFVRSEEIGNYGAIQLDYTKISAKEGYIMDYAGPVGTIITASPFYNRFDITIHGKAAHASKPHLGVNAIAIFAEGMKHIQLGKINKTTLVNIGVVHAGHVRNTVPGTVIIEGEVRSFIEKEVETYSTIVVKEMKKAAKRYKGSLTVSVVRENPGYQYEKSDMFIKKTQKIIKSVDSTSALDIAWGCSDANIFKGNGIKVLNLGNGGKAAHTTDESVEIEAMEKLMLLLKALVVA